MPLMTNPRCCAILRIASMVRSEEWDQHLGFRTIEAMRNFAQHRGFVISGIHNYCGAVEFERPENNRVEHSVFPYFEVSELAEDSRFSKELLAELRGIGEQIDLRPFIREYVASGERKEG